MKDRIPGREKVARTAPGVRRYLMLTVLVTAGWLPVVAAGPVRGWVVRAEYPVPEAAPATTDPVYWVFTVMETRSGESGVEWKIRLADRDGRALARAEFWYRPGQRELSELRCWEWRKGRWLEANPAISTVGNARLLFSGALPLDLMGDVPLATAARERTVTLRDGGGDWCFAREFQIREERRPGPVNEPDDLFRSGGPLRETVLTDSRDPGRSWRFLQAEGAPWWSRCETPRFRAELVSVERGE